MSYEFEVYEYLLVIPVEGTPNEAQWEAGPLPLTLPDGGVTDAPTRRTYFDERAASVLYGSSADSKRQFRMCGSRIGLASWMVDAIELISVGITDETDITLLIVHLRTTKPASLDEIAQLSRVGAADSVVRAWLANTFDGSISVCSRVRRPFTIVLAADRQHPSDDDVTPSWTSEESQLWFLASTTPLVDYRPPRHLASEFLRHLIPLSSDWSALVLRDGASFLWLATDSDVFLPIARIHVRSIYVDALILGILQQALLGRIADQVAALHEPHESLEQVIQLEGQLSRFRTSIWWNHITSHGIANTLLRSYQEEHRLKELHDQIVAQLQDFSRQAQLASEVASVKAGARTNRLLALLAILGIPIAIGQLAAALVVETPIVLAVSLGAILIAALILIFTPGARALRPPRKKGRQQ